MYRFQEMVIDTLKQQFGNDYHIEKSDISKNNGVVYHRINIAQGQSRVGVNILAIKLTQLIRGWVNYFGLADMKSVRTQTDEWLRRKIRGIYWKQWKKVKTRYRMIKKFGMPEWKVHELANCRKGIWRASVMLNSVLTNKIIIYLLPDLGKNKEKKEMENCFDEINIGFIE